MKAEWYSSTLRFRARSAELLAIVALSAFFAGLVSWDGVPALRHDWDWPVSSAYVHQFLVMTWSGWWPQGIGHAVPYPSSYLLALPLWLMLLAFGPAIALIVFLFGIGCAVVVGARTLAARAGAGSAATIGLMAFALFNPWVYSKVVAGHVIMVMAYGGTMLLAAQIQKKRLQWIKLGCTLLLIYAQIQFFLIAMLLLLLRARSGDARRAFAFGVLIFLPTAAGMLADFKTLGATPYTLAWERTQSVAPLETIFLLGYFARYAEQIAGIERIATAGMLALGIIGFIFAMRKNARSRTAAAMLAIIGVIAGVVATGTRGPIAPFYAEAVQRIPETGLFRELYDLLGYLAIAYVGLAAFASRLRAGSAVAVAAGVLALGSWFVYAPTHFFVAQQTLPAVGINAPPNTRYAIEPAFQPLMFGGRGSGIDPNTQLQSQNVSSINTLATDYPESAALALAQTRGDTRMLAALSVATIVPESWLRTDSGSLHDQLASDAPRPFLAQAGAPRRLPYLPELSFIDTPHIATLPTPPEANSIFFGDVQRAGERTELLALPTFYPIAGSRAGIDPKHGWVSAALTIEAHPRAAQAIGGVATSSRSAVLRLRRGGSLLVNVRGTLRTRSGDILAANTHGYTWTTTPLPARAVLVCEGFCVVAGRADAAPPLLPSARSFRRPARLMFSAPVPWLVLARIPAGKAGVIRYNVRYDKNWAAYAGGTLLPHLQIDHLINGWLIAPSTRSRPLVIIEETAALQTVLEIVGTLGALTLLAKRLLAWRNRFMQRTA